MARCLFKWNRAINDPCKQNTDVGESERRADVNLTLQNTASATAGLLYVDNHRLFAQLIYIPRSETDKLA